MNDKFAMIPFVPQPEDHGLRQTDTKNTKLLVTEDVTTMTVTMASVMSTREFMFLIYELLRAGLVEEQGGQLVWKAWP